MRFGVLTPLLATALAASLSAQFGPVVLYHSDFDGLTVAPTQNHPGHPGQDGWHRVASSSPSFGEFQSNVAIGTTALHQFTSANTPPGAQVIDRRSVSVPDLTTHPLITLRFDFYCHSSDLQAVNSFYGSLQLPGGPHPGFRIVDVTLTAGNGTPKAGNLCVNLGRFDGVNNNAPVPLTVGQQLTWDTWHSLVLIVDHGVDRYVSLTVDGQTEDLSQWPLPRSGSVLGQRIEAIDAIAIPFRFTVGGVTQRTDDDVYWDDILLTVSKRGQPNGATASLVVNDQGLPAGTGPGLALVPGSGPDAGRVDLEWSGPPNMPLLLLGGLAGPHSLNLGCPGWLDLDPTSFAVLFDGLGSIHHLFFRLDAAGRARHTFWLPLPLPAGPVLSLQGLAVQTTGCPAVLTAATCLYLAEW